MNICERRERQHSTRAIYFCEIGARCLFDDMTRIVLASARHQPFSIFRIVAVRSTPQQLAALFKRSAAVCTRIFALTIKRNSLLFAAYSRLATNMYLYT